ncbi:MAG: hypothetical protein EHM87_16875 [Burkholderiales bacterium]|nr:MAG: hypothetical protein EHM87_16875 [Burkholderiales bacterium]
MDALPADVRQELVMVAAAFDGHAVTTHRFRSPAPPAPLADTLRERWRAEGLAVVESRSADWTVLSVRGPDGMRTVQFRPTASGTEGLVSTWRRAASNEPSSGAGAAQTVGGLARWLPDDARVLRQIDHGDPGRQAATLVALVPGAPQDAASRLRRMAAASGFVDDPGFGGPAGRAAWYRGGPHASGEALAFRRGGEALVATVAVHDHGTAVVLHWGAPR